MAQDGPSRANRAGPNPMVNTARLPCKGPTPEDEYLRLRARSHGLRRESGCAPRITNGARPNSRR